MLRVENRVGRLIELRISGSVDLEEVRAGALEIVRIVEGAKGRVVACSDLRRSGLFHPDAINVFIEMMKKDNPKIERNAMVLPESKAVFELQMERLLREAGSKTRRLFHAVKDGERWLNEVLNVDERLRLRTFLTENEPPK